MAIYRPRRSAWPTAAGVGVLAFLVGLGAGYLAFGNRPPDLDAAAAVIQDGLTDVRGLVEVAAIEYREAVPNGEVSAQSEYDGAREALDRARTAYGAVASPLGRLAPRRAAAIAAGLSQIESLVDGLAPPDDVDVAVEALVEELQPAIGS